MELPKPEIMDTDGVRYDLARKQRTVDGQLINSET